jgi:hypothetical protein
MVLGSQNRQYRTIREVYHGKKNDVVVCQDLQASGTLYKTVWRVRDREVVRSIIQLFHEAEHPYEACFGYQEGMCFVFPYEQERSLERFYSATIEAGLCERGQIWMGLVMKCMTCALPAPILYLILQARQVRLGQDGTIHFLYCLDLEKLEPDRTTADCAEECARLLGELMELGPPCHVGAELLKQRIKRKSYDNFIDLYKDIRVIADDAEKKGEKRGIGQFLADRRHLIYRTVFTLCIILLVITVVFFLGKLVFGSTAFYQLFRHAIDRIGTESLLQ